MDKRLTEAELAEKLASEDNDSLTAMDDRWRRVARVAAEATGYTLAPEILDPGVYRHEDGSTVVLYDPSGSPVHYQPVDGSWAKCQRDHLTPAIVVPTENVSREVLTETILKWSAVPHQYVDGLVTIVRGLVGGNR